jgi:hypothetical protein
LQVTKTEETKVTFVKWGRTGEEFVTVYFKEIGSHSRESVEVKTMNFRLHGGQNEFQTDALVINLELYPWRGILDA